MQSILTVPDELTIFREHTRLGFVSFAEVPGPRAGVTYGLYTK